MYHCNGYYCKPFCFICKDLTFRGDKRARKSLIFLKRLNIEKQVIHLISLYMYLVGRDVSVMGSLVWKYL